MRTRAGLGERGQHWDHRAHHLQEIQLELNHTFVFISISMFKAVSPPSRP